MMVVLPVPPLPAIAIFMESSRVMVMVRAIGGIPRLMTIALRVAAFAVSRFGQVCEFVGESPAALADALVCQTIARQANV